MDIPELIAPSLPAILQSSEQAKESLKRVQ